MNEKPEALRLAERIDLRDYYDFDAALHCPDAARLLLSQLAEIERLKAERDEAVKAEREACAKVAESYEPRCEACPGGVSNAIRARGEA